MLEHGGAGGGAIQLVSLDEIVLAGNGVIDVGAGGGEPGSGGGSGGMIVLEAPHVRFTAATTGIAANGGAGGGCGMRGADAMSTTTPAIGPQCGNTVNPRGGGNGGTATLPPTDGGSNNVFTEDGDLFGGGGGAVGRARIATIDGMFENDGASVSAAVTTDKLTITVGQ